MNSDARLLAIAVVLAATAPTAAHADAGAPLAEPSRAAALAGATTARAIDAVPVGTNPAAMAGVERPVLTLWTHGGELDLWYARTGEGGHELGRGISGLGAALVVRLPGPRWLQRVRLGVAAHVPFSEALRIEAPVRRDEPMFPLYGDRAARTAAVASIAVELPYGIGVGAGLSLLPTLWAPTYVSYDATRGETPDENVVVDLPRELRMGASALVGAYYRPIDRLSLGVAWRGSQSAAARGPNDLRAGGVVVDAEIDFYEHFAPMEIAMGVAGEPLDELVLSADVVWSNWSDHFTIHHERPVPRWHDVWNVRAGLEWNVRRVLDVRAGYAFEPSPVPPQTAESSFLDADRHVLALGLGVDLERLVTWFPARADVHARWHVLGEQTVAKDAASLPDGDSEAPGKQITTFGYPGLTASGSFFQLGLSLTFPLVREGAR